jgi:hypothetical protein
MEANAKSFDVELCFRQSYDVYRSNWLLFAISSLVVTALGIGTLTVLMGPLWAGFYLMILKQIRTGEKSKFDDLFLYFNRAGRLILLFYIKIICMTFGFFVLIVPGILISTIWMYAYIIAADKDVHASDALSQSYKLVTDHVFWKHLVLIIIIAFLEIMCLSVHYLSPFLYILVSPLLCGIVASAYHQIADENSAKELAPAAV